LALNFVDKWQSLNRYSSPCRFIGAAVRVAVVMVALVVLFVGEFDPVYGILGRSQYVRNITKKYENKATREFIFMEEDN
jgi:hypothetical protein